MPSCTAMQAVWQDGCLSMHYLVPRWCRLVRPRKLSSVVLVVLQGLSIEDFEQHMDSFPALNAGFLDVSCARRQLSHSDCWLPWCELCTQTAFPLWLLASLMWVVHTDSFPSLIAGFLDVSCAHRQLSHSDCWLPWCELCTQTAFLLRMLASLMWVVHTDGFPSLIAGFLDVSCAHRQLSHSECWLPWCKLCT